MSKNQKVKILIIEDDPDLVELYSIKFDQNGYEVKTAINGRVGLDLATIDIPDIILLDMLLPEINGFSILKQLKDNPKTKDIKVIALTNLGQENDIKKIFDLGADDCLIKANFVPKEVYQRVEEVRIKKILCQRKK